MGKAQKQLPPCKLGHSDGIQIAVSKEDMAQQGLALLTTHNHIIIFMEVININAFM